MTTEERQATRPATHTASAEVVTWAGTDAVTEASTLELAPGVIPAQLVLTNEKRGTSGTFNLDRFEDDGQKWVYRGIGNVSAITLIVFND